MLTTHRNITLAGTAGRPFLLDVYVQADGRPKPAAIFAHGFKGFKDWGHWGLIAEAFARAGFVFLKFNFSHNGTTIQEPAEFADLEAFGHNNYSKELADLDAVLDWLEQEAPRHLPGELQLEDTALIGHSRGGAIAIIKAAQDARIAKVATWAAVSGLDYAWDGPGFLERWREQGVYFVENARTKQQMPLYYQLYEDFKAHEAVFDVQAACQRLSKPLFIAHGTADPGVPVAAAHRLHGWAPDSRLHLVAEADHVFGGSHPYPARELPPHSRELVEATCSFLRG